ncbi:MAG TPA: TfoX/Sxy family protein [Planctomycetota bacterium]|nr:TfoX/Sxy family protein [Planctomycetota bacterium]
MPKRPRRPPPPVRDPFVLFVLEQLEPLPVSARAMFGGHGIYAGSIIFGIIDERRLYFKVDDAIRGRHEERGMGPFHPTPSMTSKNYFEVPEALLERPAELRAWAEASIECARRSAASRGQRRSKR